jgi:ribosomal protein S18 acetylase RimI-like enzyme
MEFPKEFRRATQADVAAIRDLTRAAYAKWVPVIGREPKPMGADYESAIRNHRFDLLYLGDVLAGLIETVDEKNQLLIENVAVSPEFQGLGLGSKLMAHAEEIATSLVMTECGSTPISGSPTTSHSIASSGTTSNARRMSAVGRSRST